MSTVKDRVEPVPEHVVPARVEIPIRAGLELRGFELEPPQPDEDVPVNQRERVQFGLD